MALHIFYDLIYMLEASWFLIYLDAQPVDKESGTLRVDAIFPNMGDHTTCDSNSLSRHSTSEVKAQHGRIDY